MEDECFGKSVVWLRMGCSVREEFSHIHTYVFGHTWQKPTHQRNGSIAQQPPKRRERLIGENTPRLVIGLSLPMANNAQGESGRLDGSD
jgi:hypothetical protein